MEPKKPTNVDTNTLMESVKNDMLNIEHGKQWIMSSYAPFKDKASFPGFVDDSFEEIRSGYYDAQKSGSGELYFQQMQSKHQEALLRIKRLQTPSPDIVSLFVQLYNTPAPVTISSSSGFFGNTLNPVSTNIFASPSSSNQQQTWGVPPVSSTSTSVFGGGTNQSNPFSNPNSTNIFAKPVNSIFGSTSTPGGTNIFAKPSTQPSNQTGSIFGQSPSSNAPIFGASGSSAFGNQSLSGNLFGASSTGGSSIFGSSNAAQSGTIFGSQSSATNSIFGAGSSGPAVFGSPATQSGQSLFGSTTTQASTIFSSPNTTPTVFGSPVAAAPTVFGSPTSLFGSPRTQSQSMFGTSTISNTAPSAVFGSPSTFGTTNAASAGIFSNSSSFLNPQALFGSSNATSQPQSIFGSAATNSATVQPSFGSLAATPQASIFGGAATSQPQSFSATSRPSIFGSSTVTTSKPASVFGSTVSSTAPSTGSIFGSSALASSGSIFGTAQEPNVASAAPAPSIFGSALGSQTTQSSGSIFGTAQQPSSIFGQASTFGQGTTINRPASSNIFGKSEVDKPIVSEAAAFTPFGNSSTPFAAVTSSSTAFAPASISSGSSPFASVSPFVNPLGVGGIAQAPKHVLTPRDFAKTNPDYYSSQLTDEDIAAFENMKFEFGAIPIAPPTVDLCA